VYFDINSVLCNTTGVYKEMAKILGVSVARFRELFEELTRLLDAGKLEFDEFLMGFNKRLEKKVDLSTLKGAHYYGRIPIKPMHKFVVEIKDKYKVGLLSNLGRGVIDDFIKHGFVPDVEYNSVIISADAGFTKPQKGIFEFAEKDSGFSGKEILFIDDLDVNVITAKDFGWNAIVYDQTNHDKFLKESNRLLTS